MEKLKNKVFEGIYRISVLEAGHQYVLEDSIVLKGDETFQIFTQQEGVDVLRISNTFHIDGEYAPDHIGLIPIIEEMILVEDVDIIYDENIGHMASFTLKGKHKDYWFNSLVDEIHLVDIDVHQKGNQS